MSKTKSNYVEYIYVDVDGGEWLASEILHSKQEAMNWWLLNINNATTEHGMFLEVILTDPETIATAGEKIDSIPTYTI